MQTNIEGDTPVIVVVITPTLALSSRHTLCDEVHGRDGNKVFLGARHRSTSDPSDEEMQKN